MTTTIVLYSKQAQNYTVDQTNNNNLTYLFDFSTMPDGVYELTFFYSGNNNYVLPINPVYLSINFYTNTNVYTSGVLCSASGTNTVGLLHADLISSSQGFYNAGINDNAPVVLRKPQGNNSINVQIFNANGNPYTDLPISQPIPANCIMFYPFDTNYYNYASGVGVQDITGAQIQGATISNTVYKYGGGSLSIAQFNKYIKLNNIASSPNGYTFSLCFNVSAANYTGMIFTMNNGSNRLFIYMNAGVCQCGGNATNVSIFTPVVGQWYNITWTISNISNSSIYVYDYTNSTSATTTSTLLTYYSTGGAAYLGYDPAGDHSGFNGYIDNFMYFNSVLTAGNVNTLVNLQTYAKGYPLADYVLNLRLKKIQ